MNCSAKKSSSFRLSLAVQYASGAQKMPDRMQLRRWIKGALQRDANITLRFADEPEGRALNKRYRGKDYATNVLTFVYDDAQPLSGDVVICTPVAEKEAREQRKDLLEHYAHLTIHAILHLQGYDHGRAADAAEMESRETAIMLKLGYADPYQGVVS
jgi:probable rRNA maturation factor